MNDDLVRKAEEAATRSYSPYSNYPVGAVLRTNDGQEFAGVNVENAAYPLTQCAETTAIGMAAAAGYRPGDIAAIGINASPCGACRQWLHEWRVPEVSFRRDDGTIAHYRADELLPDTWNLPSTE
jgi:cytidine deaminase